VTQSQSSGRDRRVSHRSFVSYIDKSRRYYAAHGYEHPYRWAHYGDVPFTKPSKPMSECRVGIVTTSARVRDPEAVATTEDSGSTARKRAFAAPASPVPPAMFTNDLSWDKDATHTNDLGTFLPLEHLAGMQPEGVIGSASPRFYGIPTDYSQRRTRETDAPDIVSWCKDDGLDVAILVPL